MGHDELPHDREDAEPWPLSGLTGTVAEAREHTRAFLDRCSPPATEAAAEDLLIAVSELVSNAVRHAPGPCTLRIVDAGERLAVEVGDTSSEVPRPRPPDLASGTGGFGWHLLSRMSSNLTVVPQPQGKTIRAVLACPRITADPEPTGSTMHGVDGGVPSAWVPTPESRYRDVQ